MTHPAINAAKTHCPKGHALVEGNLEKHELAHGMRLCSTCRRERQKYRYHHHFNATRRRYKAKALVLKAIRKGLLVRLPCEVCGMEPTQAHHNDYRKPLQVRWLCRKHHVEHHQRLRQQRIS